MSDFGPRLKPTLPWGVADRLGRGAAQIIAVQAELRALFRLWGYTEIIPPTFEFADMLATGSGDQFSGEMYRFLDRDGRALALRTDFTIQTARVVGSKLYDQPLPLRFCYAGSVFRYEDPQAGRQREFTQAGIELIGSATADADAEVLALVSEALLASGLPEFQITLGQMAFFRGLVAHLGLRAEQLAALRTAIDRKSAPALRSLLDELHLGAREQAALLALPDLTAQATSSHVLARSA